MKRFLFVFSCLVVFMLFFQCDHSTYSPVIKKAKGKETIPSVVERIEHTVWNRLQSNLNAAGLDGFPSKIMIVAFKEEQKLHVYGVQKSEIKLIKEYPFTAFSGKLGPKLKEGDKQIPEGIYQVEYFNPNSAFYLSFKINYPNEFDQLKTQFPTIKQMGGDIFIHGKAATVGCIPIGDEGIEEVFILAQKASKNRIKVIISPRDFRKNKVYPSIDGIDWEEELYDKISDELHLLPI